MKKTQKPRHTHIHTHTHTHTHLDNFLHNYHYYHSSHHFYYFHYYHHLCNFLGVQFRFGCAVDDIEVKEEKDGMKRISGVTLRDGMITE